MRGVDRVGKKMMGVWMVKLFRMHYVQKLSKNRNLFKEKNNGVSKKTETSQQFSTSGLSKTNLSTILTNRLKT